MKNKILILLLALLVSCAPAQDVDTAVNDSLNKSTIADEPAVASVEPVVDATASEVVDESILDSFSSGKPIVCEYVVDNQSQIIYLINDNVRLDIDDADSHGIFTKDMMYVWSGNEGSVVSMSDIGLLTDGQDVGPKTSREFLDAALDANSPCLVQDFSTEAFVVPSDVKFVDLSAALKDMDAQDNT